MSMLWDWRDLEYRKRQPGDPDPEWYFRQFAFALTGLRNGVPWFFRKLDKLVRRYEPWGVAIAMLAFTAEIFIRATKIAQIVNVKS